MGNGQDEQIAFSFLKVPSDHKSITGAVEIILTELVFELNIERIFWIRGINNTKINPSGIQPGMFRKGFKGCTRKLPVEFFQDVVSDVVFLFGIGVIGGYGG